MRERVGRKIGIVEDRRFGLAREETDLQFLPELAGICALLSAPQPFQVTPGQVAMSQAVMGHRQEDPVLWIPRATLEPNPFLQPVDRVLESTGAIEGGARVLR